MGRVVEFGDFRFRGLRVIVPRRRGAVLMISIIGYSWIDSITYTPLSCICDIAQTNNQKRQASQPLSHNHVLICYRH